MHTNTYTHTNMGPPAPGLQRGYREDATNAKSTELQAHHQSSVKHRHLTSYWGKKMGGRGSISLHNASTSTVVDQQTL